MKAPGRLWLLYWPAGLAAGALELTLVLTSNPSAWSSARAEALKLGWSSTMRTLVTTGIVAQASPNGYTANRTPWRSA